jgi:hypothetical protein
VVTNDQVKRFAALFAGRTDAYGTGEGRWVRKPVTLAHYEAHLRGFGKGLGIAPLRDDGTIRFAAIDLDEPDFQAARDMQAFLPGDSFIEKSRSGNAHVWVFFDGDVEAWPVRGILKAATEAAGKSSVEVFPKQDRLYPELRSDVRPELGNYINLPMHGDQRPLLRDPGDVEPFQDSWYPDEQAAREHEAKCFELGEFLDLAYDSLNDPDNWRRRAEWLQIPSPEERGANRADFGTQKQLHMCAEHIIANREQNPVMEGHRNVVYFSLAKMLLNYEYMDEDEAWYFMKLVNEASPDIVDEHELRRIFNNALVKGMTSTGCDDPLMSPYVHPDCPIARRA